MKTRSTQAAMRTARRVVAAFARHASSATADRGGVDHRGERGPRDAHHRRAPRGNAS